jgi:hypothetical protein
VTAQDQCTDWTRLPLSWGGEVCCCVLPAVHVFDSDPVKRWHRCSCSTQWVDDQQVDEDKRLAAGEGGER